ncbi:uncharacterized protein LOC133472078 isoform X4 [Phyllopteryx taeniolatus]|uniref:uncharacterized protein LOC133472078 isoform X4 n=1 Tax=Phyllopteryx taeniolatus TaxID=161469 RepID=UPI002AD2DE81|nr:uncharacterized protein LOC133472078 isoform X4 [Phyllopteryx taeniolatus]
MDLSKKSLPVSDVGEKDFHPEQQEWRFRMDQQEPEPLYIKEEEPDPTYIKEEEEAMWHSEKGERLQELEFPVIRDIVKTESDEDTGQRSQCHPSKSEETRGAELPSRISSQHKTTESDGDHSGESQADRCPRSRKTTTTTLGPVGRTPSDLPGMSTSGRYSCVSVQVVQMLLWHEWPVLVNNRYANSAAWRDYYVVHMLFEHVDISNGG